MKTVALALAALFVCSQAAAVEIVSSQFSVDFYRLYFSLHLRDLPLGGAEATVNLYSEQCIIPPVSYERFGFGFIPDSDGDIVEPPEVVTVGTPAEDRWFDGPTDHLSLSVTYPTDWRIYGSIQNGPQRFVPGDHLCMRISVPGLTHVSSGLLIGETPGADVFLKKSSTTRYISHSGQVVPYSYRIENISAIYLHDIALGDDNVDAPPVCAFSGNDELAPAGQHGSVVFCTAEHTVTQDEIDGEAGVTNTATVTADELDPVMTSVSLPAALFADSFDNPPNAFTLLESPENDVGRTQELAIGADGKAIIAYHDASAGNLKVAKCLDVACTAAIISVVHGGGNDVGHDPSIAIGVDTLPVISYHDATAGALLVARCNDEACRDGDESINAVDDGNVGTDSSITIAGDGMPIISYRDRDNGLLKVAHCNDVACAGGDETITPLNDPDEGGLNTSIAIGIDGFPVISFQTFDGPFAGMLSVAKCNDASCAGADETITMLDTTGSPGFESTSLAVGADGNPVIAYIDTASDAVTVVKCNDAACAGDDEVISTVDSSATYMNLSLALAPDGNPVVSYLTLVPNPDPDLDDLGPLRFARCNDDACTGEDESIVTVDSDVVARTSSVAIGSDGLPIISYYEARTGALKVVHCGALDCR